MRLNWNYISVAAAIVVGIGGTAGSWQSRAAEVITIEQYASPAPNVFGSPSWSGYLSNAMNSLQNGLGPIGNPATDPTAYRQVSTFTPGDIMVTSFPSWQGVANPAAPFNNELGNRLHFGVSIIDQGGTFSLSQVSFSMHSNDTVGNYTDAGTCPSGAGGSLCWENNLAGTNFGSGTRIGVYYGGDGVLGGGDDIVYNSGNPGNDTVLINALYYVGDGNAEWPGGSDSDPSNPLLGRQGSLDDMASYIMNNLTLITNVYCVEGKDVCNTATIAAAPEPATITMLGLGLLGSLGVARTRRRHRPSPY